MVQAINEDPFFRVPPFTYDELPAISNIPWRHPETLPCSDLDILVIWKDGKTTVEDIDHDSDPQWWIERGVIGWVYIESDTLHNQLNDLATIYEEYNILYDTLDNIASHFGTAEGCRDIAMMGLEEADKVRTRQKMEKKNDEHN